MQNSSDQIETLEPGQPQKPIPDYKVSKKQIAFSILFVIIFTAVAVLRSYHVDYVEVSPGTAEAVGAKIQIAGVNSYPPKGTIRFLTVLVSVNRPTLFQYLKAKYYDDDTELLKWKDVFGNVSENDNSTINEALMKDSQSAAKYVALTELGCKVDKSGEGAIVSFVEKKSPASDAKIKVGSTIIKVDDIPIQTDQDAIDTLGSHKPGDVVKITYNEKGSEEDKTLNVTLAENPKKKGVGFFGVGLVTHLPVYNYPVSINIDPGDVSGPSAGLAFTLSLIDQLTKGELTGDKDYAVTGEIHIDGSVGQVGGVKQKAIAAKKAGAKLMIVPKGEGKEAKSSVPSMEVFEVENIGQALSILADNGGDALPQVRACPNS